MHERPSLSSFLSLFSSSLLVVVVVLVVNNNSNGRVLTCHDGDGQPWLDAPTVTWSLTITKHCLDQTFPIETLHLHLHLHLHLLHGWAKRESWASKSLLEKE